MLQRIKIDNLIVKIPDFGDCSLLGYWRSHFNDNNKIPVVEKRLFVQVDMAARGAIDANLLQLRQRGYVGKNCVIQVSAHHQRN